MKFTRFTGMLLLLICTSAYQSVKGQATGDSLYLNFQQSMQMMLDENYAIKAANLEVQEFEYKRKEAKSHYYPHLGFKAAYTVLSDPLEMHLDMTGIGSALKGIYEAEIANLTYNSVPDPVKTQILTNLNAGLEQIKATNWNQTMTLQEQQLGLANISVTWALYTGGKIMAANKAAQARLDEMKIKKEKLSDEQITKLVQTYFGLQMAMEVAQARKEVKAGIGLHLNDANKLFENGMISEAERLHAEVAFADANRAFKKSAQDVELLQIALQSMLSTERKVVPMSSLFIKDELPALDNIINKIDINNPIIRQLEAKERLAQEGIRKERSEYLPTVAVMGYKDLYTYQVAEIVPEWAVGVGVTLNIFDGLARENKIKSAKLVKERVGNYKEKAKLDLRTYATQTYQKLLQAQEQFKASEVSLNFAKEYLRIRNKAFNEGFATSTEVNDAQLNLLKVKTERLKAMYDFDMALSLLLQLSGESQQFSQYLN